MPSPVPVLALTLFLTGHCLSLSLSPAFTLPPHLSLSVSVPAFPSPALGWGWAHVSSRLLTQAILTTLSPGFAFPKLPCPHLGSGNRVITTPGSCPFETLCRWEGGGSAQPVWEPTPPPHWLRTGGLLVGGRQVSFLKWEVPTSSLIPESPNLWGGPRWGGFFSL